MSEHWKSSEQRHKLIAEADAIEAESWERQRDEHFEKAASDKRLTDRAAGPPHKGWVWDCDVRRPPHDPEVIHAWTPPELLWENAPGGVRDLGQDEDEDVQADASANDKTPRRSKIDLPERCYELLDALADAGSDGVLVSDLPDHLCERDVLIVAGDNYLDPNFDPATLYGGVRTNMADEPHLLRLIELGYTLPTGFHWFPFCFESIAVQGGRGRKPRLRLTQDGQRVLTEWRLRRSTKSTSPTADRKTPHHAAPARTSPDRPTQWLSATKGTEIANQLTGVGRDWASYWRRFCEQHGVHTRPGQTKGGQPTEHRREVEIGSLVRAIIQNPDDFEKATPEREKRRQAIRQKIRAEHGLNDELRNELLSPD